MPGAPNMKMYSRDDLMKNNFGTEGDDEEEDEDEEEGDLHYSAPAKTTPDKDRAIV
jgi:hypothetical protein